MTVITRTWMRCRDTARRRRHLGVAPHVGRRRRRAQVTLVIQGCPWSLVLDILEVGQLRAVLRDAIMRAAELVEAGEQTVELPAALDAEPEAVR